MGLPCPASNKKVWILSLEVQNRSTFYYSHLCVGKSSGLGERNWETWAHIFYSATKSENKSIMLVLSAQAKNTESCLSCSSLLNRQRLYAEKVIQEDQRDCPCPVPPSQSREVSSKGKEKHCFHIVGSRVLVDNWSPAERVKHWEQLVQQGDWLFGTEHNFKLRALPETMEILAVYN